MTRLSHSAAIELVVIGASAGAVEALTEIVPSLAAGFPAALAVVVHLPPHLPSSLHRLLAASSQLPTREAEDKEPIERGTVYFAPPNYHLLVERNRRFSLDSDAPVNFSRPSIDLLFESAADSYAEHVLGIILTGASADGAKGLLAIREAGGYAIVQDPHTALLPIMPKAAIQIARPQRVCDVSEIAATLRSLTDGNP